MKRSTLKFSQSLLTLSLLLTACTNGPGSPLSTTPNVIGLLEVRVEGVGTSTLGATARFVGAPQAGKFGAQTATVVADAGLSFVRQGVSFLDDDAGGVRYTNAIFNITNTTARVFNNLTFYAINVPGTTIGGTAVANILAASGAAITDQTVARKMMPAHRMRRVDNRNVVDAAGADMQVFSTQESIDAQSGAARLTPPVNGDVLEYGYVARNYTAGRQIGAANCVGMNCNKGQVTFAYRMPLITPRSANPWAFSLYFVVANDDTTSVTQSREEQNDNSLVQSRAFLLGNAGTRATLGSTLGGQNYGRPRTAGSVATPVAQLEPLVGTPPGGVSGTLDTNFGPTGNGLIIESFTGVSENANAIAGMADGRFVVVGGSDEWAARADVIPVARYLANGTLDTTFDVDGKRVLDLSPTSDDAYAVIIQPDGKIVLGGGSGIPGDQFNRQWSIVRLNVDGSLDATFGTGGRVDLDFSTTNGSYGNVVRGLALQSNGKIVAVGPTGDNVFQVVRLNSNGALDTTFDGDGKASTTINNGTNRANAVAIQSDGKIVVGGGGRLSVARFNVNGSLDTTFGANGSNSVADGNDELKSLALQPNGKIVVTGGGSGGTLVTARFNADGLIDTSFSGDGVQEIATQYSDVANGKAVLIDRNGKIVVGGRFRDGSGGEMILARINANGSLDTTFGPSASGSLRFALGSNQTGFSGLLEQPNGRILAVSTAYSNTTLGDVLIAGFYP